MTAIPARGPHSQIGHGPFISGWFPAAIHLAGLTHHRE